MAGLIPIKELFTNCNLLSIVKRVKIGEMIGKRNVSKFSKSFKGWKKNLQKEDRAIYP